MGWMTLRQLTPALQLDWQQLEGLLEQEGIELDGHLSYTVGLFEDNTLIATGSYYEQTLRCLAVSKTHQGGGLMNQIVTHLTDALYRKGIHHVFLVTKPEYQRLFEDLGFFTLVKLPNTLVFMENKQNAMDLYLKRLVQETPESMRGLPKTAGLVMNANPFTLGHLHLVTQAAQRYDAVHLFVVQAEASVFSFEDRYQMIADGVAHLNNVVLHASGPYVVSMATFPSYFLKEPAAVVAGHAALDVTLFGTYLAKALGIQTRIVGEEPLCETTRAYVEVMAHLLPTMDVSCEVIPRVTDPTGSVPISASKVRQLLRDNDWQGIEAIVPPSTLKHLKQMAADGRLETVKQSTGRH